MSDSSEMQMEVPARHFSSTPGNETLIEINKLVKIFHTPAGDFPALQGVDLCIHPGEFLAIIGKSGSGKSTLINMITGIDKPTSGEVIVEKTKVHDLKESQIAVWRGRAIGIVFQFFQLLPTLTAIENVMLPMDFCKERPFKERYAYAMHLLDQIGMADCADKLPGSLSGGQLQSVAIARALANDPRILAADEPTGNLDAKTADHVFRLFESLVKSGKTILLVTHDNDLAERAGRIVSIADGLIVSEKIN